jgi:hypothetical protein
MRIAGLTCTAIVLLACGSCQERKTGSFEEQSGENLIQWSAANPYVNEQTWAGVETLSCRISTAKRCGPNDCRGFKPVTLIRWHPSTKRYERCGGTAPCDVHTAEVRYSGAFANITVPDTTIMARLTANGDFMEVLTHMDAALVYHGQCRPA